MKNRILIVCLLLLSIISVRFLYQFRVEADLRAQGSTKRARVSHNLFDQVLQAYVDKEGRVDYAKLKGNPEKLEAYLDMLATTEVTQLSYNAQLAFWINAYNALVIKGVLDHYPTKSIRKIKLFGGFFYRLKFQVAGKTYTLNQIEHDIIRSEFVDPRVHFVLVCASISCPPLIKQAFSEETIEGQLETATYNFIRDPDQVRIDRAKRKIYLSKIFKWYKDDFKEGYDGIADFLADYLSAEDATFLEETDLKFHYLDYNWGLNDKP